MTSILEEKPLWLEYDDIAGRQALWAKRCEENPIFRRRVNPDAAKSKHALCVFCGQLVRSRAMHQHVQSAVCTAGLNRLHALQEGYLYAGESGYVPGSLSRTEWAQPFLKKFATDTVLAFSKEANRMQEMLCERYWAVDWWWRIAVVSRNLKNRDELMTQVKDLYFAGKTEELENLIGGIELAAAPL